MGSCRLPYDKELWVQRPGGGFVNLAQQAGITAPHARGRDSTVVTLADGRIVLAIANEQSQPVSGPIDRSRFPGRSTVVSSSCHSTVLPHFACCFSQAA